MESTYLAPETVRRMAAAAAAFMGCLDEAQRSVRSNGFELDGVRRDWSYLPAPERDGLALGSLSGERRGLAHRLIAASVSMTGYAKVVSIVAMTLLDAPGIAHLFDPERYCMRVFGTPGADAWGWQLAGHPTTGSTRRSGRC